MQEKVQLLPRGQFILNLSTATYKGRFSLYALEKFCTAKKIESFFNLLDKIAYGMSIGDYADLILFALQDYYRTNPELLNLTRADILDFIDDEFEGINTNEFLSLITHAVGRINKVESKPAEQTEEDKKKL